MGVSYVVPLGHEYDDINKPTCIGPVTAVRCRRALQTFRRLQQEGEQAFMVLPTSSIKTRKGHAHKTMGLMMYDWFIRTARATDIEYIVNQTDHGYPHTTYGELLWALPQAIAHRRHLHRFDGAVRDDDLSDMRVVIVSNERHLRRARWIIDLMLPHYRRGECPSGFIPDKDYSSHYSKPSVRYEASPDAPSSLGHEFFAYVKLGLMWSGVVKT